jgi:hypothetical protein
MVWTIVIRLDPPSRGSNVTVTTVSTDGSSQIEQLQLKLSREGRSISSDGVAFTDYRSVASNRESDHLAELVSGSR